jgi:hypothetical protein
VNEEGISNSIISRKFEGFGAPFGYKEEKVGYLIDQLATSGTNYYPASGSYVDTHISDDLYFIARSSSAAVIAGGVAGIFNYIKLGFRLPSTINYHNIIALRVISEHRFEFGRQGRYSDYAEFKADGVLLSNSRHEVDQTFTFDLPPSLAHDGYIELYYLYS